MKSITQPSFTKPSLLRFARALSIVIALFFITKPARADDGMMVKMLEGIDSAQGKEGQQYAAIVARDANISGTLVPKGSQAVVLLIKGVGNNAWTLQLAAVVLNQKIMLVRGVSPIVVPMGPGDFLSIGKKTISTPARIAVAAGLTVRFSVPGPLTPAPANVTQVQVPAASGQSQASPSQIIPGEPMPPGRQGQTVAAARKSSGPAGPENDMFANRIRLTGMEAHSTVNDRNATVEVDEPRVSGRYPNNMSLWWEYTPPENGKVLIDLAGTQIGIGGMAVFEGSSFKDMVPMERQDNITTEQFRLDFQGKKGETYQIATVTGQTGVIQVNVHLVPNNLLLPVLGADNFADRRSLEATSALGQVDNLFFTSEPLEPNHTRAGNGNSAWWKWKAPANGMLLLDCTGSWAENSIVTVYVGDKLENLRPIAHVDAGTEQAKLQIPVKAGVEYQIVRCAGRNVGPGSIRVNLHFIPRAIPDTWVGTDAFDDRPHVKGNQAWLIGDTLLATVESGEPKHACDGPGPDINTLWWGWTAPASGRVTIDANGGDETGIDLAAYSGTSIFDLTKIAERGGNPDNSRLEFDVKAGVLYSIVVNGVNGDPYNRTNVVLHLNFRPGATGPRIAVKSCQ